MFNIKRDAYNIKKVPTFDQFFKIKSKQISKFNYNECQLYNFRSLMISLWYNMSEQDKRSFFKRHINRSSF